MFSQNEMGRLSVFVIRMLGYIAGGLAMTLFGLLMIGDIPSTFWSRLSLVGFGFVTCSVFYVCRTRDRIDYKIWELVQPCR